MKHHDNMCTLILSSLPRKQQCREGTSKHFYAQSRSRIFYILENQTYFQELETTHTHNILNKFE